MNMRLPTEDRTSRAIIRDETLRLFADSGPDAVTIRQVASAAGVSPGLVIQHFGSKVELRRAVDDHVAQAIEQVLAQLSAPVGTTLFDASTMPTVIEAVLAQLPCGSAIPRYLGRLLLAGGSEASRIFARLHSAAETVLAELVSRGMAEPGTDAAVRAAVLLVNDLAVLILRERITEAIGVDPLTPDGMRAWGAEVTAIYRAGLTGTHKYS